MSRLVVVIGRLVLMSAAALGLASVPPAAAQGSWTSLAPMPVTRFDLAVVAHPNGRLYAFGGSYRHATCDYCPLNHVESYDPATDIWSAVAPLPTARAGAAAVVHNGRVLVFGGHDHPQNPLATVEEYDPAANTWTARASMPTARAFLGAAAGPDGRIYAMGGSIGNHTGVDTVEAYDPDTDTWTTVASMPTARYVLAAVTAPDGLIYAIAGADQGVDYDTVEAYDPAQDTWTTAASLSAPRYNPAATLGPDGRIYVVGGAVLDVPDTAVEIFDLNAWSLGTPMPSARYDLGLATLNGVIYAVGGFDAGPVNTVEAYVP